MKSRKKIPLSVLRKRLGLQFREAARLIAEGNLCWACVACDRVGGAEMKSLLCLIFLGETHCFPRSFWLGDALSFDGHESFWDDGRYCLPEEPNPRQMQRVVGLLLCAEYVKAVSRAELRACGYEVS